MISNCMTSFILFSMFAIIDKIIMGTMLSRFYLFLVILLLVVTVGECKGSGSAGSGNSVARESSNARCIEREKRALLEFKRTLHLNDRCDDLFSWGSHEGKSSDCCQWRGIRCDNQTGHVTILDLRGVCSSDDYSSEVEISSSLVKLSHLNYLDLSDNKRFAGSEIPKFMGSLGNLRYLNLSYCRLGGEIPDQLGNLSSLHTLDLSGNDISASNLKWLSRLSQVRHLNMNEVWPRDDVDWLAVVETLPFLTDLILSDVQISNIPQQSNFSVNASKSLAFLDLSGNNLDSSTQLSSWLSKYSHTLVHVDLSHNELQGPIPDAFGNMISLQHLDLSNNKIQGDIPKSFRSIPCLKSLKLWSNNISGFFVDFVQNLSPCTKKKLEHLNLRSNQMSGPLPDPIGLTSLKWLDLSQNQLNGTVPTSIGLLSEIEVLGLSHNFLEGLISESHFSHLSKLRMLSLGLNSDLSMKFNSNWVPPFEQLDLINLRSCKLGPHFPYWLLKQHNYFLLDISCNGISEAPPIQFWELSPRAQYLNLSNNYISGTVPNISPLLVELAVIDLGSNNFSGSLPLFSPNLRWLDMSNNSFSGSISHLCAMNGTISTGILDLSNNLLSGELPDCWMNWKSLACLDLENNDLSGRIPSSMGHLSGIQFIYFRNNGFSGELSATPLWNCTNLHVIDLAENNFSGNIPTWIGESLTNLLVLILKANYFLGNLPSSLCSLSSLKILDLSLNNISGVIPNCLNNFTAMTLIDDKRTTIFYWFILSYNVENDEDVDMSYQDHATFMWKGLEREYKNTLGLVRNIDLSSNQLTGEIPRQIVNLVGLQSLNLSRNNINGPIPLEAGLLNQLESLDLSRNQISGEIPIGLSNITYLGYLDLSNNNLSGRIPTGTQLQSFSASAYENNSGLCGPPITAECPGDETAAQPLNGADNTEECDPQLKGEFIGQEFYFGMGLGFMTGFWGVFGSTLFNKSWRCALFKILNGMNEWLVLKTAIHIARWKRLLP